MPSSSKIRVGIIGYGKIPQVYFKGSKGLEVLKIIAFDELSKAQAVWLDPQRNQAIWPLVS